jgi:hypothetical protein
MRHDTGCMLAARLVFLAALAMSPAAPAQPAATGDASDPWAPLRLLVGDWVGEGSGFDGVSDVEHAWRFVLGDRFLRLETRSTARGEDGSGEVHEDVGYLSRDADASAFVFRQFLGEGYVNTFDVVVDAAGGPVIDFGHRESENAGGMRVRMRLAFDGDDEYKMRLDLAFPGQDFATCQRMTMRRHAPGD